MKAKKSKVKRKVEEYKRMIGDRFSEWNLEETIRLKLY